MVCLFYHAMTFNNLFLVFMGGGIGSVFRWWIGRIVPFYFAGTFPVSTFAINCVASLLFGLFISLNEQKIVASPLLLFLTTGFCGGFSTFSTFAFESFKLFKNGELLLLISYNLLSLVFGLLSAYLGYKYFR